MLENWQKFRSLSVLMFGYVFQNTNGRNRGITLLTLLSRLNAIYADANLQVPLVGETV